jgi:hypothetical protein
MQGKQFGLGLAGAPEALEGPNSFSTKLEQRKAARMGLSCQDLITFPDRPTATQ